MNRVLSSRIAALAALAVPGPALACGGLFCNNSQPVVQQAENILFVVDDQTTHMHVRITYGGPPQEFGWLLPVPRGVETAVSTEQVFQALGRFAPSFQLNFEFSVECQEEQYPSAAEGNFAGADAGAGGIDDRGVQVISREPVGPYDRAILDARSVDDLRAWLDENGYQVPDQVDATLRPYVDSGAAVFVAIKLLPGQETGDLVPLHLSFPGNAPTIPIVPTAVATQPDLGIVAQVLGDARAIPLNYRHVQINEAAIDWMSGGNNYFDVVAQASDEAGGRAFTTDFAGPHQLTGDTLSLISLDLIARMAEVRTLEELGPLTCELDIFDADVSRILRSVLEPPAGEPAAFLDCAGGVGNAPGSAIDGAAIAERIRVEINTPRETINAHLAAKPYLTRLFTTMSAEEMTEDPTFAVNPDAAPVDNVHRATGTIHQCTPEGWYDYSNIRIVTESGLAFDVVNGEQSDVIRRQDGQTVRKGDEPAAAVIEQYLTSGEPTTDLDNVPGIQDRNDPKNLPSLQGGGDDGCGCSAGGGGSAPGVGAGLLLLALGAGLRRRRR
jgi:MYXO-CTERM domain-containing protein